MAKITRLSNGMLTTRAFIGYDANGNPVQKRISAPTKRELNKRIKEEQTNYVPREEKLTLEKAYRLYISSRENILSPATIRLYKHYIKDSFVSLMRKDINEIKKEDVQREINEMSLYCSPKTLRNKLGLLNSVYKAYTNHDAFRVNLPMKQKPSLYIPTEDVVKELLEEVKDTPFEIPIMFACYCGMRRGEIFALTYDDIDFQHNIVKVTKAIGITDALTYEVKTPKSYAGYRDIDIPLPMMETIRKHIDEGYPLIEISIVQFSNSFDTIRNRLCNRLCIPKFRFHDLRHYYASILVTLGIPDIYAMKLIGHSTTNFLRQNYQHTMSKQYEQYRKLIQEKMV